MFDQSISQWVVQGTEEEIEHRRKRAEYENSPIIITIKELVKRNPVLGWKGSAEKLIQAVYDITGKQLAESATSVGKFINKYQNDLYFDDIEHKESRTSKERSHIFTKRSIKPYGYQSSIYHSDEE